ncbi:hypothetical protein M1146_02965 [Patescibacteria group bacterium]|nr:hypothetical protein [Patescibacteria group bacterium]
MAKEQFLQYNIGYDRRETDTRFLLTQLETHLRERFNVLLSRIEYEIVDGHLVRPGKTEPFIESIKRGRDLARRLAVTAEDFEREDADVIGFEEKIDPVLSNLETPIGVGFLNISPPSGKYEHNFYDIALLKERYGERYVEYSRYSSGLMPEDYARILPGMDPESPPTPAEFLASPILITDTELSADRIHEALHKDHEYMEPEVFAQIWHEVRVQGYVDRYLARRDAQSFNAILNFADEVWENMKRKAAGLQYKDYSDYRSSTLEIRYYENKEVRQVPTACPGKSGADVSSLFSVSDLDFNYKFDQPGPCKKCGMDVSCGPCGICKGCDIAITRGESLKKAA